VTSISMTMLMDMSMGGLLGDMGNMAISMDISMIMEDLDILAEMAIDVDMLGDKVSMKMYIVDGYTYMDDGETKTKVSAGAGGVDSMLSVTDIDAYTIDSSLYISSISKSTEDGLTVYTVVLADSFMDLVFGMSAGLMGDSLGGFDLEDMSINVPSIKYYADSDGALKKMVMKMEMKIPLDMEGISLTIPVAVDLTMIINAIGDDVKVNLPDDLDEYIEIDDLDVDISNFLF